MKERFEKYLGIKKDSLCSRELYENVLDKSIKNGDDSVSKCVLENVKVSDVYIKFCFLLCSLSGNLEMITWIYEKFDYTLESLGSTYSIALNSSQYYNHQHVFNWLCSL